MFAAQPLRNSPSTQSSKLLPLLFKYLNTEERVTVFHVGPAAADTVDFFSGHRCKLHFIDVFAELPIVATEDTPNAAVETFRALLRVPRETRFDICLFWDLFNYLDGDAIRALLTVLRPHLTERSLAHAFSVHNRKTPETRHVYGIHQVDALSFRHRADSPPGYAPHSQRELTELLHCFRVERSVLLPDSRLEVLLQARI
jgi:hypothetical protein